MGYVDIDNSHDFVRIVQVFVTATLIFSLVLYMFIFTFCTFFFYSRTVPLCKVSFYQVSYYLILTLLKGFSTPTYCSYHTSLPLFCILVEIPGMVLGSHFCHACCSSCSQTQTVILSTCTVPASATILCLFLKTLFANEYFVLCCYLTALKLHV